MIRTGIYSDCCFLELVVQRSAFWIVDWTHGPFWGLVVTVLIVAAGTWEFDAIELDVASGGSHLNRVVGTPRPMWVDMPLLCLES